MPKENHNPKHKYDCGNCKFNWSGGFTCACGLKNSSAPPAWLKEQLAKIQTLIDNEFKSRR